VCCTEIFQKVYAGVLEKAEEGSSLKKKSLTGLENRVGNC
jgi:hypothetical protein